MILQLYKWISSEQEPLSSYSTGLLAVAMELTDVATEKNSNLVPEMLVRLGELEIQEGKERDQARSERLKRQLYLGTITFERQEEAITICRL